MDGPNLIVLAPRSLTTVGQITVPKFMKKSQIAAIQTKITVTNIGFSHQSAAKIAILLPTPKSRFLRRGGAFFDRVVCVLIHRGRGLARLRVSEYRLSKIKRQDLLLVKEGGEGLQPGSDIGRGKSRSKKEEWLSRIISRLNEVFITDGLTDQDLINYAYTIRDKEKVMDQIANNLPEQALLGDFGAALDDAVMDRADVHQNQMNQYLNNAQLQTQFRRVIFDLLLAKGA